MSLESHYPLGGGVYLDLEYLAHDLADDLGRNEDADGNQLIKFILAIDSRRADLNFTQRLYAAIGDELRKELEADERT